MKENVSIIFAAIIGTFLIVILPLYSILDRQDSMSYNVVLTATTNFVDNVRNNGFIDKESYNNYIREISSTGNTYKVKIEAYKNVLIHETDETGKIIPDSYIEEKELYNTQDILKVLEGEASNGEDLADSNRKNNVYLFDENDEIYIKVYNTNITAGSIIYSLIADVSNNKVIDISYGGVINKVNWELYDKLQVENTLAPEVVMSVPVNAKNSTNIQKVDTSSNTEYIDCTLENLEDYVGETSIEELCADYAFEEGQNYTYLYDLSKPENKTIKVAVELRRFEKINTGADTVTGSDIFTPLSELTQDFFNGTVKEYIIENYIRLNGMNANIDLKLRKSGDYYVFNIILTDVRMSILDFISTKASITVLPGLGQDENETLSIGGESIEIELLDESLVNTVVISQPYIWNKLLSTKSLTESRITNNVVYANEDIAFVISYTGINSHTDAQIVKAIKQNLKIYISNATYSDLEIYTDEQLNDEYEINLGTETAGHVLVKFKYTAPNESNENYIKLEENWIATDDDIIVDPETGEEIIAYAAGASSVMYQVLSDTLPPVAPLITLEGVLGDNGWYTSDVTLNLIASKNDMVIKNGTEQIGGSGVDKSTVTITGAAKQEETDQASVILSVDGISTAIPKAYDFVGNVVTGKAQQIKIDKTAPTAPKITLSGTEGTNGWYTSDVTIDITPGTDEISGVARTTYKIEGANVFDETTGTKYVLTKEGKSIIIATTYDKAGNKTETEQVVYIEKTKPKEAVIEVISGEKNDPNNEWYVSDVTLRVTVNAGDSISGLGQSAYRITGNNEVPTTKFDGTTHEITITTNGTHNITVYTYTAAGNYTATQYTVKIDKDAPNAPTLKITQGTEGENGWHISDVEVQVISNGDVGTSVESLITYTITREGTTSIETEIKNNGKITFNKEGEYILTVYSRDTALNVVKTEKVIKIDKTAPTPAEFVINGTKGNEGWYISDVAIAYQGESDDISGINSVVLSTDSITKNTNGTKVTLITKDNAGHTVTKEVTIKLDKSVPTKPTIELLDKPTGSGIFTWQLYNKNVRVKITPGVDTFVSGIDNSAQTKYKLVVVGSTPSEAVTVDKDGTIVELSQEGQITVIASTYDKAGNVSVSTSNIWIDKSKTATPKIVSINGEDVSNVSTQTITGKTNTINIGLDNTTEGYELNIILVNQETYERTVITKQATTLPIDVTVETRGTYSIVVNQTNEFGTISDTSTGLYYYVFE